MRGSEITLYAFGSVPEFARGLVRDVRVRWALEEAGLPYREKLIDWDDLQTAAYRALQPFGQIPAVEIGDFKLFESGAIVLRIAEQSDTLMPRDPDGRARTMVWAFAALNSVEPAVQTLGELLYFHADAPWAKERRPSAEAMVEKRLSALEARLDGREYLEDRFSAGDLLMTTVLRMLRPTDQVTRRPALRAYQARCEARPAFQKALADHLRPFADAA